MDQNPTPPDKRAAQRPDQESVWDYPRPPRIEDTSRHIQVVFNGIMIAETRRAKRVLETSHPPTYYIPLEDIKTEYLRPADRTTFCEWKGAASYYTIVVAERSVPSAAWFYPRPTVAFQEIAHCVAFYASKMDACFVDGERVQPQAGDLYGGWITGDIAGPFKGGAGTRGW